MSDARELRDRIERLPREVEQAKSGSDPLTSAEVLKYAEQLRTTRAELAQLDKQLSAQSEFLWSRLISLREGQARDWEASNREHRRGAGHLPGFVLFHAASAGLGAVLGGNTPLVASPTLFGIVAVVSVAMAGWSGWLRGRVDRAITRAQRVL